MYQSEEEYSTSAMVLRGEVCELLFGCLLQVVWTGRSLLLLLMLGQDDRWSIYSGA
jgi:hypothetical protein